MLARQNLTRTGLNMVIGYPLEHSQSPWLHNTIYKAFNINAVLLAFPHKTLKPLIDAIKILSVELTAVTMPFKQEVLHYLDDCNFEVKALQAANTLIQRNGKLYGYNTDVDGVAHAFANIAIAEKNVLIIGAGGAARALGYFMQEQGANLFWLNRNSRNADEMAKTFGGQVVTSAQISDLSLDIIANATPLGMHPYEAISPLPNYAFHSEQLVFDVVYNPLQTELLKQAQARGAVTISGYEMFIGQGFKQIELWTGKKIKNKP